MGWTSEAQVDGIHVSPEICRSMELGVVGMVKMKCGGKSGGRDAATHLHQAAPFLGYQQQI